MIGFSVTAVGGSGSVTLSWDPVEPGNDDITYKIYMDTKANYSILESYAFDDTEEEAKALKELDADVALDIEIMESLNTEKKIKELTEELNKQEQILSETQKHVDELKQSLKDLG